MLSNFQMPPSGFGPGSQPTEDDGMELDYLAMPSGMQTFAAHLPEIEDTEALAPALAFLAEIAVACDEAAQIGAGRSMPLDGLDAANRALVLETLGEGEVSAICEGDGPALRAQESVFAGVWVVADGDARRIEVAPIPRDIAARAFEPQTPAIGALAPRGPGVVNAPALVAELMDQSAIWRPGADPHVVNLSLLPHTPEDLDHLETALGTGSVRILSRGYGNCRVSATGLANLWRVQFFNSSDALILDTFEVSTVPEVALAAREDFEDSAVRLCEVLEAIR